MLQYMVISWEVADVQSRSTVERLTDRLRVDSSCWNLGTDSPGLCILFSDVRSGSHEVYEIGGGRGYIFGKVFNHDFKGDGLPGAGRFDSLECDRIVESQGRYLVERYWGSYVAFLFEPKSGRLNVIRSPQGRLPCYMTNCGTARFFFSSLDRCMPIGLLNWTLNEQFIANHVYNPGLRAGDTGIKEIAEVIPGQCCTVEVDHRITKTLYWSPANIARQAAVNDLHDAAARVRHVTERCIWSWAAGYRRILHNLSGGLDSAVVLSCLKSAPSQPEVVSVNYFDSSAYGDERKFARMAASAAQCRLLEVENGTSITALECLNGLQPSPSPTNYQGALHYAKIQGQIAADWNIDVSFDGSLGDQLFYNLDKELIAIDQMSCEGLGQRSIRTAAAVARAEGASVWRLLATAAKIRWHPHSWKIESCIGLAQNLITPELLRATRNGAWNTHPWLEDTDGLLPGKRAQIFALALAPTEDRSSELLGLGESLSLIPALYSQPLAELCLQIPTFVHSPNGTPRLVERLAFADAIPTPIAERVTKGIVDAFLSKVVDFNREFLRDFMLDGWLVKQGLLDRGKIDALLTQDGRLYTEGASELLYEHLNTEAWIRSVEQLTRHAAQTS
jgi:asparagine synthase (glutamine-hydrolysing)